MIFLAGEMIPIAYRQLSFLFEKVSLVIFPIARCGVLCLFEFESRKSGVVRAEMVCFVELFSAFIVVLRLKIRKDVP